ncbi:MAG: presenilin family intramembrane aspartyl protease [Candidatus Woesearchaeota archaeon]
MKHDLKITIILVTIFLISQFAGLFIVSQYMTFETTPAGEINVTETRELPGNIERVEVENPWELVVGIFIAIIIGTILILVLRKYRLQKFWKGWFVVAVVTCMTFALNPLIGPVAALITSVIFGVWKVFWPNFYVHNLTEIFIYGGLAAIFVPIDKFNVVAGFLLLIVISLYDIFAVWQSKHMVKLAEFQTDSKVFAGLMIPYVSGSGKIKPNSHKVSLKNKDGSKRYKETQLNHNAKLEKNIKKLEKLQQKDSSAKNKDSMVSNAILGGGDIGFPLIFAGAVMKSFGFTKAMIIPVFAAIALLGLLLYSKKGKFYPAMPFITAGCTLGYVIILLL